MPYLPIFVDVRGRRCVVIGGGEVAARKVSALLEAGAQVTVVSPELCGELGESAAKGGISYVARRYRQGDLRGCILAYAASDDSDANREAAAEAEDLGILINVVDTPHLCSFIAPSVVRRGDLQIAISTAGASPAVAKRLRQELEGRFGAEWSEALDVMRAARRHLMATERDPQARAATLSALAASPIAEHLSNGDMDRVNQLLADHLGAGVGMAELGLYIGPALEAAPEGRSG